MIINLPSLSWFYQPENKAKNSWTGSKGSDPFTGCMNRNLFEYKVYVEVNIKDPVLKAECCVKHIGKASGKEILTSQEMEFDVSGKGLKDLNEWLDEQYLLYKENYDIL